MRVCGCLWAACVRQQTAAAAGHALTCPPPPPPHAHSPTHPPPRSAPPVPVASLLSPVLWQLNAPDRFDMYSLGILVLQLVFAPLRSDNALIAFNRWVGAAGGGEWRVRVCVCVLAASCRPRYCRLPLPPPPPPPQGAGRAVRLGPAQVAARGGAQGGARVRRGVCHPGRRGWGGVGPRLLPHLLLATGARLCRRRARPPLVWAQPAHRRHRDGGVAGQGCWQGERWGGGRGGGRGRGARW